MAKRRGLSLTRKKSLYGYLFVLPWIIGFLFFFMVPIFTTLSFSFNDIEANGLKMTFVGFQNYIDAFRADPTFPVYLVGSLTDMLMDVPVLLVFSLFAAVLIQQKFHGNGIVRTIFFLTVILSSGVFLKMQAETGATNAGQLSAAMQESTSSLGFLQGMNVEKYLLDAGISQSVISYITTPIQRIFDVIMRSGIQVFIFLAGLNSISPSIYEACKIEGASGWESFWKITFPMISPMILLNMVYTVIDSFTAYTNQTLTYISDMGIKDMHLGPASAMSWIYFLVIGGVLVVAAGIVSRLVYYQNS